MSGTIWPIWVSNVFISSTYVNYPVNICWGVPIWQKFYYYVYFSAVVDLNCFIEVLCLNDSSPKIVIEIAHPKYFTLTKKVFVDVYTIPNDKSFIIMFIVLKLFNKIVHIRSWSRKKAGWLIGVEKYLNDW